MSGSEGAALPKEIQTAVRFLHRFWRGVRRSWSLYRESRLGIAGLVVVIAFGAIAVLAPFISPYSREFEAPESDRFEIAQYPRVLTTLPNLTYNLPVMGPTTPLSSDRLGGVWMINSAQQGLIFMDFLQDVLGTNTTPYQAGNLSLTLDITQDFDYGALPIDPFAPLTAIYYISPGQNSTQQTGPGSTNGAVAFFVGQDFVVVDPFSRQVIFHERLGFTPLWTGENPASAGQMVVSLTEKVIRPFPGLPGRDVGPYHYFFAADASQAIFFEITYVHSTDVNPDGSKARGQTILYRNVPLSAPPFVYYTNRVERPDDYRSGQGQAILIPLANGTLEVRNVTGARPRWIPLTLGGQPATISGSIGFTRTDFPLWLYLPLRSSAAVGLATFDVGLGRIVHELSLPFPAWESSGMPTSYRGEGIYFAFYDATGGPAGTTHVRRMNATGAEVPQFRQSFPGRLTTFFEVEPRSKIFVVTEDSRISMVSTVSATAEATIAEQFGITPPSAAKMFVYAGALGGTLFGLGVTQQELNGAWLEPANAQAVVFQLLGTVRTPLPPGTYPSGHHYILGTDFRGGDILTQLFWGTQVAFIVGVLAAAFAVGLGTFIGLISGYYGGVVDTLLMRTTDIFLVLPFLPIVLVIAAILSPSIWVIILVLGIVGWPGIARVIRAHTLTLKERPFVDAARVTGASDFRVIFGHVAPNVLPFAFLFMTLGVAGAIVTEAFLSFLGLGDPRVISWGGMLSTVLTFGGALTAWWWLLPPGLAITVLSLGFYLLGRGFDEIVNPRLRRR